MPKCQYCEYETEDTSNFKKHMATEKHEWYVNNSIKLDHLVEKLGYHKCKFCKYITSRRDNLLRHYENSHNIDDDDNPNIINL